MTDKLSDIERIIEAHIEKRGNMVNICTDPEINDVILNSYAEYQRMCAFYGFVGTPLTEDEYARAMVFTGNDIDEVYAIGCDVAAGFELETLIGE